jgi:hypothetical protein
MRRVEYQNSSICLDARLAIVFCAWTLFRQATKLNFRVKVIFHREFRCCMSKHDKLLNGLITKIEKSCQKL